MSAHKNKLLTLILLLVFVSATTVTSYARQPVIQDEQSDQNSTYAAIALNAISFRKGVAVNALVLLQDTSYYSELAESTFQQIAIFNKSSKEIYKLAVNHTTLQVLDRSEVKNIERHAFEQRYGKFEPVLAERLSTLSPSDRISATIVLQAGINASLADFEKQAAQELNQKYPEVRQALSDKRLPFDLVDRELSKKVYDEYIAAIDARIQTRVNAFTAILDARKVLFTRFEHVPAVVVTTTKQELLSLARLPVVNTIFSYSNEQVTPTGFADSLYASNVDEVWDLDYKGSGTSVAVVEPGYADVTSVSTNCGTGTNNCYSNVGMLRQAGNVEAHATGVSSVIASNKVFPDDPDATFGVAPETTLHRAGSTGSVSDIKSALSWALDTAEADVVSSSICNGTVSTSLTDFDWFYDYSARLFNRLLVNASGNKGACTNSDTVQPPARGWNVLTVGAYDHDTGEMWPNSQWQNPSSGNEKPDVVAPGVDINFVGVGGNYGNSTGTSLATPQVAGIAALLIERHPELRNNPTALKAILMATATTNIDGDTGIVIGKDSKDGAGGVNALHALESAANRRSHMSGCDTSCWIAESLTANDFVNGTRTYSFYAEAGDRIRIATSWWATAESNGLFGYTHELNTDLDVYMIDPNGNFIPNAYGFSANTSVELIPQQGYITAQTTGYYLLNIYKYQYDEPSNLVGIAYHRQAAPSGSGVISGEVWYDEDLNGVRDPDTDYLTGSLEIRLYEDTNNNGVFEPGCCDAYITTVVTPYDGQYMFPGIRPGNYWVQGSEYYVTTTNPEGVILLTTSGLVDDIDFGVNSGCIGCS